MAKTIEQLLDEAAIKELQIRYCRAADRDDAEALRNCFHPDATTNYGEGEWNLDQYMDHATHMMAKFIVTTHNTGNQLVEVDGDSAWAEHYTVATHRDPIGEDGTTHDLIAGIRYIDRLEKRGGEWRLLRRQMVPDWHRIDQISGLKPGPGPSRRDRSDPSYLR